MKKQPNKINLLPKNMFEYNEPFIVNLYLFIYLFIYSFFTIGNFLLK